MRIMDVFFALPALLLALVIVSVLGPGINTTVMAIAIVYTPIFARVARGPVLSVKEMEYITATRCLGMSDARIILRAHPAQHPRAADRAGQLGAVVGAADRSGLELPRLGHAAADALVGRHAERRASSLAEIAPWLMLFPALAIILGVLGFNLLGDGLRDVLDPRLRGQR